MKNERSKESYATMGETVTCPVCGAKDNVCKSRRGLCVDCFCFLINRFREKCQINFDDFRQIFYSKENGNYKRLTISDIENLGNREYGKPFKMLLKLHEKYKANNEEQTYIGINLNAKEIKSIVNKPVEPAPKIVVPKDEVRKMKDRERSRIYYEKNKAAVSVRRKEQRLARMTACSQ